MVKKRAKSVVCAAVFFLMAVPSPVWAGEEESLQVENRIVLDKVEIVSGRVSGKRGGERSPWETPECSYPGEEISKIPVIENQGCPATSGYGWTFRKARSCRIWERGLSDRSG